MFAIFKKNIQGIHHLHQYDGTFVTDICYKSSKLFFTIMRSMKKILLVIDTLASGGWSKIMP